VFLESKVTKNNFETSFKFRQYLASAKTTSEIRTLKIQTTIHSWDCKAMVKKFKTHIITQAII